MQPAPDLTDYVADPVGRYGVGRRFVAFCARPDLWGFAMWGRVEGDDLRQLLRWLAIELGPPALPHGSLVDVRRFETSDPEAFTLLAGYVATHFAQLARQVTRLAIVRPTGLTGATVAGFFSVQDPPYPVKVFTDPDAAAAWLGADRAVVRALDAAIEHASGVPAVVAALQAWLDGHLVDATLPAAARGLAMSARSLQRRLAATSTTFQRELDRARVRVAQRLLGSPDATLTQIAYDVGCASPQHFSALFRRVVGETPSQWRARRRA